MSVFAGALSAAGTQHEEAIASLAPVQTTFFSTTVCWKRPFELGTTRFTSTILQLLQSIEVAGAAGATAAGLAEDFGWPRRLQYSAPGPAMAGVAALSKKPVARTASNEAP